MIRNRRLQSIAERAYRQVKVFIKRVICIRKVCLEGVFHGHAYCEWVRHEVQAPDDTPLLYVLRNDLQLIGPQFGCGLAQCGACAVLIDGKEVRSCVTPVASVAEPGNHHARRPAREMGKTKGPLCRGGEEARFTQCSKPGSRSKLRSAGFARTG